MSFYCLRCLEKSRRHDFKKCTLNTGDINCFLVKKFITNETSHNGRIGWMKNTRLFPRKN